MRLLDLFCGRFGWSKAFAARGWECVGVDLVEPVEIPRGCKFRQADILSFWGVDIMDGGYDFICASPPCQQFSKFGMPNFYPHPPYPEHGIRLFNHARQICEESKLPYVIENVWGAQKFVGDSAGRCGPFHLWGSGVPPITPQGIKKGGTLGTGGWQNFGSMDKADNAAKAATIPPELSACVADYAERLIEQKSGLLCR